jgi:metallophosphoesterase superfamily enzyme
LHAWRREWSGLAINLVIGNHDRSAGLPPAEWNLEIHPEPLYEPPFVYAHHPLEHAHGYTLCGHLHPAYALRDRLARNETLKCFWFKSKYGVLPSFGSFTGNLRIQPGDSDLVFLAGPRRVIPVPQGRATH